MTHFAEYTYTNVSTMSALLLCRCAEINPPPGGPVRVLTVGTDKMDNKLGRS